MGTGTLTSRNAAVSAIAIVSTVAVFVAQAPNRPTLQSLSTADLEAFIARTVADQHAIGVTVGVMQDGKVIFNKGYGLAAMSKSLTDAGEISQVETGSIGERGGLEVSTLRMLAGTTPISTLMYRAPDGKFEEFLFSRR